MQTYLGEPLNILHTIGLDQLYPLVRCQIDLDRPLDISRLKQAVKLMAQVVPELLGHYDLAHNTFVVPAQDKTDVVHLISAKCQPDELPLDWMQTTQVKLYVQSHHSGQRLTIFMSHILSDGAGFKAFLYRLAACYNDGEKAIKGWHNEHEIAPVEALIDSQRKVGKVKQMTDHPSQPLFLPQLKDHATTTYHVGHLQLSSTESLQLKAVAHRLNVTLNDLFMAAFGQIIQQYSGVSDLSLACPTDMRQYFTPPADKTLRIANYTARYNLNLANTSDLPLAELFQLVHQQMQTLKQEKQFLQSVAPLVKQANHASLVQLQQIVEDHYHVRPIAYTNFGILDPAHLKFKDVQVKQCIMTGSFRQAPMYQVAVSSFGPHIILAFNLIGSQAEYRFGMMILRQMKQNMLALH